MPATSPPPSSQPAATPRKKRTLRDIRDSKRSGKKMVCMSVPDDTSAQWAGWLAPTWRWWATAWP